MALSIACCSCSAACAVRNNKIQFLSKHLLCSLSGESNLKEDLYNERCYLKIYRVQMSSKIFGIKIKGAPFDCAGHSL